MESPSKIDLRAQSRKKSTISLVVGAIVVIGAVVAIIFSVSGDNEDKPTTPSGKQVEAEPDNDFEKYGDEALRINRIKLERKEKPCDIDLADELVKLYDRAAAGEDVVTTVTALDGQCAKDWLTDKNHASVVADMYLRAGRVGKPGAAAWCFKALQIAPDNLHAWRCHARQNQSREQIEASYWQAIQQNPDDLETVSWLYDFLPKERMCEKVFLNRLLLRSEAYDRSAERELHKKHECGALDGQGTQKFPLGGKVDVKVHAADNPDSHEATTATYDVEVPYIILPTSVAKASGIDQSGEKVDVYAKGKWGKGVLSMAAVSVGNTQNPQARVLISDDWPATIGASYGLPFSGNLVAGGVILLTGTKAPRK